MIFPVNAKLLDACVLGILNKSDYYGYKLTQDLVEKIEVSESTLYPVLRRLQKSELLGTYDKQIDGRNRRYYHITDRGKEQLKVYTNAWKKYKESLDSILKEG